MGEPRISQTLPRVTPAGRRVLALLAEGDNIPEVALKLGITRTSAASTVKRLQVALSARNIPNLVSVAYERNLLPFDGEVSS